VRVGNRMTLRIDPEDHEKICFPRIH
jgi:hypothetical protein